MPPLSVILRWLDAHGAYLLALLPVLVGAWKAMPAATRARLEASSPRLVGLVRFVARIVPDILGAWRIAQHQIAQGEPRASVTPAVPPRVIAPDVTTTVRDVERGGSGLRGFAKLDALALALGVGALCFASAVLVGCPLPPPDGCTPRDTRCAPDGVPEVCSSTQRWTRGSPAEPCPSTARCCRARSPYGRELHACVPPSACLPEPAAVLSTPSALAGSQ